MQQVGWYGIGHPGLDIREFLDIVQKNIPCLACADEYIFYL